MLDTEDASSSSSTSVPITEHFSSPVLSALKDEAIRSFRSTQQLRASLQMQKSLMPYNSSWLSSGLSSHSLLVSSLGGSVRQHIPTLIQSAQEAAAHIRPALASYLIADTRGIGEMAARSALAQIKTIAPPSLPFFQRERHMLQAFLPPTEMLQHLFPPMAFSSGLLTKSFFPLNRLLIQQVSDLSHHLNASLITLTRWLPAPLWKAGDWLKFRLLAAFGRAKLCLAPSLPEGLTYQIMSYVEAGDLRPVTLLLWSHYSLNRHAHLRQALNSWFDHPEFAARRHIFEEALASHCDGRYVASIRMLTPEIEGLGSYIVREHNLRALNKNGKDIGLRLGKTTSVVNRMIDAAEDTDSGLVHWVRVRSTQNYLDAFVSDTDFESDYEQVRNNRDVNRHGIAHGFQIQGYAWLNSLRLFLLLDTIHYLLQAIGKGITTSGVAV